MATADRTTIKAAVDALLAKLRTSLVASPPTAVKPFRRVELGELGVDEYARPYLVLAVLRARPIGGMDNDKLFEIASELRVVTDASASDAHAAILDKIGAVEDALDGVGDTGILEGSEGYDDRVWTFGYPKSTSGPRVVTARAEQSFVVKVQRGQNRVPAP